MKGVALVLLAFMVLIMMSCVLAVSVYGVSREDEIGIILALVAIAPAAIAWVYENIR